MVCAECMKTCCLGGKNSVVKGLSILETEKHLEKKNLGAKELFNKPAPKLNSDILPLD